MRAERLVVATLTMLATLALVGCSWREEAPAASDIGSASDDGYRGAYLDADEAHEVPSLPLTDTDGEQVDLATARGRSLVFFGFSRCTTLCPVVLSTLATAVDRLPAGERDQVQVLFVTTDPEHDTAAVLRRHLDRFDPRFRGLSGSEADVAALAEALGVRLDEGRSTAVASVSQGRADLLWTRAATPGDVAQDLQRALAESPGGETP